MKPFNSADPTTWVSEEAPAAAAITKCPLPKCNRSLTQSTQKGHMERFHFRDGISQPCGLCPSPKPGAFSTPFNFMRHIRLKHSSVTTKYKCNWPKCGSTKAVRDKSDIYKHVGTAHQQNAICATCQESCLTKAFLSHTCHPVYKKSAEIVDSDDDFEETMPRRGESSSAGSAARNGQKKVKGPQPHGIGTENCFGKTDGKKCRLPVGAGAEIAKEDNIVNLEMKDAVSSAIVQCENRPDGFVAFKCDHCHTRFYDVAAILEHKVKCEEGGVDVAAPSPAPVMTPAAWRAERGRVDHIDAMVDGLVNGANKATQTTFYSQEDGDLRQKLEREIVRKDKEIAGLKRKLLHCSRAILRGAENREAPKPRS